MAHTKSSGAAKNARDSGPKYLGVKKFDGERVKPGDILIRQRGTHFFPGTNTKRGGDDTLYAMKAGAVKFTEKKKIRFDGSQKRVKVVNVVEPIPKMALRAKSSEFRHEAIAAGTSRIGNTTSSEKAAVVRPRSPSRDYRGTAEIRRLQPK